MSVWKDRHAGSGRGLQIALLATLAGLLAFAPSAFAWSVSLSSNHRAVNVTDNYTLTATTDRDIRYYATTAIYEDNADGTHTLVTQCSSGTTCPGVAGPWWPAQTNPSTHHYHAEVSSQGSVVARSSDVAVDWRPYPFKVTLSIDNFSLNPSWGPDATAHIAVNYPITYGTPFRLELREVNPVTNTLGSNAFFDCNTVSSCSGSVGGSRIFKAVINYAGTIWATSQPVELTHDGVVTEGVDGFDLVALAGMYGSVSAVCEALTAYPGTHFAGSSLSDQLLACEAAESDGLTIRQALVRIAGSAATAAAAAGVTAPPTDDSPMPWLAYQPTSAMPGNNTGTVAPQTLPAAWPLAAIQSRLIELNPSLELTNAEAKSVANQCLWLTAMQGLNGSDLCTRLPIFASGADVAEATSHDLESINPATPGGNPGWVKLNYLPSGDQQGSRDWVRPCGADSTQSCDEYPFWATEQGGPNSFPTPLVKPINANDNTNQGGKYGNFTVSCLSSRSGAAFLGIPTPPSAGIPTLSLCNAG